LYILKSNYLFAVGQATNSGDQKSISALYLCAVVGRLTDNFK